MYVTMKPLLKHAATNHYAVMAANVLNMEMARAVISAADEKQAPLIIIIGSMAMAKHSEIGRASCRERVCAYV